MDETNIDQLDENALHFETRKFGVEGMNCDACVQSVEEALRAVDGVQEVHVDLTGKAATVRFDRRKTDVPALHDALLKSGYKPSRVDEGD
jgi:copper chaperone